MYPIGMSGCFLMSKLLSSSCSPLSKEVSIDIVCVSIIFIIQCSGKPLGQVEPASKSSFLVTKRDEPDQTPIVCVLLFAEICAPITSNPAAAEVSLIWSSAGGVVGRFFTACYTYPCTAASMGAAVLLVLVGADLGAKLDRGWGFPSVGLLSVS